MVSEESDTATVLNLIFWRMNSIFYRIMMKAFLTELTAMPNMPEKNGWLSKKFLYMEYIPLQ